MTVIYGQDRWDRARDTITGMDVLERDGLWGQLDGLLAEASWGRGRLVVVRAEAGMGKSMLVEGFANGRAARVLWGYCDPIDPPRPLAPITDIAERVGGELRSSLADDDRHRIFSAFLGVLRADGGPWVAVLEDLQWADEATLELLRVVGRRIAKIAALVIVTFRDDDVGPEHALPAALGDVPATSMVTLRLPPLSLAAVTRLSAGTSIDPVALHRVTGGNPFFVTEVIASGGGDLPSSVREAVWARALRLSPAGLAILRTASVLGQRCEARDLSAVAGGLAEGIDECVARQMLRCEKSTIEFRHELTRRAVLGSLGPAERAALHGRALAVLRETTPAIDPAELVHHAIGASDGDAVLELAPKAGAHAAALGAHRAARAHYDSAVEFKGRLSAAERASLMEAHAHECYVTDAGERAINSQQEALAIRLDSGDTVAVGVALSELAQYLWWTAQGDRGVETASEAVDLLESVPAGGALAQAYARLAQLSMMSGHNDTAIKWAKQAVALGEELHDEQVVVHALNTLGSSEICIGLSRGWEKIEESLRRATAAYLEEDAARAYNNLICGARQNRNYQLLDRYLDQAEAFFDDHDLDANASCFVGDVIEAQFDRGGWPEARLRAQANIDKGWLSGRTQCLAVLGRLAARRGDIDAFKYLDEALDLHQKFGDPAYPLQAYRAEAAWLAGDVLRAAREVEAGIPHVDDRTNPWDAGELALWAYKAGVDWASPRAPAEPYRLHLDGYPEKAAAAWAALGCPFEEARALADTDDEAQVRRALAIFQSLGASRAAALVTDRLRAMGARRIARGPRAVTRSNPAGLSDREVEVLILLANGLRNSQIAERLVVSTRTVDHHVSAVLAKLGVHNRYEAGLSANKLGLSDGHASRAPAR
jgi:DNA-binding CsgD family transcriptional regulator